MLKKILDTRRKNKLQRDLKEVLDFRMKLLDTNLQELRHLDLKLGALVAACFVLLGVLITSIANAKNLHISGLGLWFIIASAFWVLVAAVKAIAGLGIRLILNFIPYHEIVHNGFMKSKARQEFFRIESLFNQERFLEATSTVETIYEINNRILLSTKRIAYKEYMLSKALLDLTGSFFLAIHSSILILIVNYVILAIAKVTSLF